jgi:hypothetical protein
MDASTNRRGSAGPSALTIEQRWLGIALITLGVGLIANSLLGPFVADAIRYPFSESVLNQTIGLEAASLFLVAPLCIVAGVLVLRGRAAGPVVAFGPAAYTAYMFLQYVIGPEYRYYPGVLPLHLGLFILGGGIALEAWSSIDRERLPRMTERSERRYGVLLLFLGAFIVSRYLSGLFAGLRGDPLPAEFRADVSMYWSIVLLDLGIVVPATIAAAVALIRGTGWGRKALYAIFGWFALVPPSVAAMAIVMVAKDDPNASTGQAIILTAVAVLFAALAVWLYRPLFAHEQYGAERGTPRRSSPAEQVRTGDPVDMAQRPTFEEVEEGMTDRRIGRGILDALSGLPLFATAPLYRSWHLRWGATDEEVRASMPGDDIVAKSSFNGTRAITIEAPPEVVWPWIVQMGYRRAGFYTYAVLDNAGYESADRVVEELQSPKIGDWIPMAKTVNETTAFKVKGFSANEWLLWGKPDSTWSWKLVPLDGERTRVITRLKQRYAWETPVPAFLTMILLEFGDFPMMRRVLKGIKVRAERMARSRGEESPEADPVSFAGRGTGP